MLRGSTRKAYQLASPANRAATASMHDASKFDRLVRSDAYTPLLSAAEYSFA